MPPFFKLPTTYMYPYKSQGKGKRRMREERNSKSSFPSTTNPSYETTKPNSPIDYLSFQPGFAPSLGITSPPISTMDSRTQECLPAVEWFYRIKSGTFRTKAAESHTQNY